MNYQYSRLRIIYNYSMISSAGGKTTTMHSSFSHISLAITLFLIVPQSKGENQLVIVQQGDTATLRFNTSWSPTASLDAVSYFTIRVESSNRPFCVDGMIDPPALLHRSQYDRFTVVEQRNSDSLVVNLVVEDVNIDDIGSYVFTLLLFGSDDFDTTEVISLQVTVPPGKAQCFITESEILWPEVHCKASAGSGNATVSCFQDNNKVPYRGEIVRYGGMIRGIFWMISYNPLHCCSHEWKDAVTHDSCLDFVFSSQPKITTLTLDTPESSEASSTKSHWDRRATEHVQEEPPEDRSFATPEYPTVTLCIILAFLVYFLSDMNETIIK